MIKPKPKLTRTTFETSRLLDFCGRTELTVTATAGEKDQKHKELALKVVEAVCNELGVEYKIVEKKGLGLLRK